jgi:hypothetical protein
MHGAAGVSRGLGCREREMLVVFRYECQERVRISLMPIVTSAMPRSIISRTLEVIGA